MLIENIINDAGRVTVRDKVQIAIQRLKSFEPSDGYWLAFSGGKDSVTIKALADMAGVKYEAHYSLTTVDPPELVRFIKTFDDVTIDRPKLSMWQLIVKNRVPPTKMFRYCCKYLKESSGVGRVTITGIRWAESVNRKTGRHLVDIGGKKGIIHNDDNDESRRSVEQCYRTQKTLINPIIDWVDEDVWEFIKSNKVPYCCLYDEGWTRLGCIGCPMAQKEHRKAEFERWPTYKTAYIHAYDRMIDKRKKDGLSDPKRYSTGEECFEWSMNMYDNFLFEGMPGQIDMEEQP